MPRFPMIHSYVQLGAASPPFNPSDIFGLTAWYGDEVNGGTDRKTLANGTTITQWDDKSGNDWHLTGDTGNYPTYLSSDNSIKFLGTDDFQTDRLYNQLFNAINDANNATIFVVAKQRSSTAPYSRFFHFGDATRGEFYSDVPSNFRIWYGTTQGSDNARKEFSPLFTNALGTKLLSYTKNGNTVGSFDLKINGSQATLETSARTTLDFSTVPKNGLIINSRFNGGTTTPSTDNVGNFDFKEFIVYNRKLSTSEIDQVETYILDKYAPFESPTSISGLQAWYGDQVNGGTDRTTLANGTTITQWDDKSGNNWHLTGTSNPSISTDKYIDFTQTEFLQNLNFNSFATSDGYTIIAIFKPSAIDLNPYTFFSYGEWDNTSNNSFLIQTVGDNDTSQIAKDPTGSIDTKTEFVPNSVNVGIFYNPSNINLNQGEFRINFADRTKVRNDSTATSFNNTGIKINGRIDAAANFPANMEVLEYIHYNKKLSSFEILQVEKYLQDKYNI